MKTRIDDRLNIYHLYATYDSHEPFRSSTYRWIKRLRGWLS